MKGGGLFVEDIMTVLITTMDGTAGSTGMLGGQGELVVLSTDIFGLPPLSS